MDDVFPSPKGAGVIAARLAGREWRRSRLVITYLY
jgi:hypothetical protein